MDPHKRRYIGGGRQATPLHFDDAENFLHVIAGTKEVYLYPPGLSEKLSPSPDPGRQLVYSELDAHGILDGILDDRGASSASETSVDAIRHRGTMVRLSPGETLYLPCCWWHAVRGGPAPNISLNYWFNQHDDKVDQSTDAAMQSIMANLVDASLKTKLKTTLPNLEKEKRPNNQRECRE